jgi:hypothetical protein
VSGKNEIDTCIKEQGNKTTICVLQTKKRIKSIDQIDHFSLHVYHPLGIENKFKSVIKAGFFKILDGYKEDSVWKFCAVLCVLYNPGSKPRYTVGPIIVGRSR